ncbi:MAG: metal-dependent hydrolase [Terriglobia bacterium]
MDTVTHTLTGIALGQAGLKRKTRYAMLALIIGSNLPDIDVVTAVRGSVHYLNCHRGITHSLIGLTALAALLTSAITLCAGRARPRREGNLLNVKWLFFVCWIATACHVLMDYTNDYGIRPFLPWSGRWMALDIMPIMDPWVLLFLLFGLGLPAILWLVAEEVGVQRAKRPAGRTGALLALCAVVALGGIRGLAHRRAEQMLDARLYNGENPARLGAFPVTFDPFEWNGLAETRTSYFLLRLNTLAPDARAGDAEVLNKPLPSPVLAAARATQTAKIFMNFARFPWATVDQTEEGYEVRLRDLRFASRGPAPAAFVAQIDLDRELRVRRQTFAFRAAPEE